MAEWPSDKELEEIYRKGSQLHDFEYRPDAWDNMEKLLDQDKNRFGLWFKGAVIIGLIALMYIAYSTLFTESIKTHVADNDYTPNQQIEQASSSSPNTVHNRTVSESNANKNSNTIGLESKNSIQDKLKKEVDVNALANAETTIQNTQDPNSTNINNQNSAFRNNYKSPNNTNKLSTYHPESNPDLGGRSILNTEATPDALSSISKSDNALLSRSQDLLTKLHPFANAQHKPTSLNSKAYHLFSIPSAPKVTNNNNDSFKRFFIGINAGVESSWTPNGQLSQIDYSLGIRTSLYLSPRWGLNLGATYLRDQLVARQGDYSTSEEFWSERGITSTLEFTEARGNMIDFSLGGSYSFNHRSQNGFSISADLGNTFMLSEWYDYSFSNEAENFSSNWNRENHSLLSSVSLSSNYRAHLSNNFLLEAGPFLRIPLSGVGHGNLKLSSIGVRIAVGLQR